MLSKRPIAGRSLAPSWFPDWRGQICAVVASGPSVRQCDLAALKGSVRAVAVNSSHIAAPWADVLYAADPEWWHRYAPILAFPGLWVSGQPQSAKFSQRIQLVSIRRERALFVNELQFKRLGVVGAGGHSGFQALNLAMQFGARRILLVGFDLCLGCKGNPHHHGPHPEGLRNPRASHLEQWAKILDAQAPVLSERGIEVVNTSLESALTAFPKLSVRDALERWRVSSLVPA